MPRRHHIPAAVFAGPDQIPGGFLLHAGNRHRHDLAQMQQPGQMPGVAGIGLHPIPRRPLQLRRRRHHTLDPRPNQAPGQPKPGRARLVGHRHRPRQITKPFQDLPVIGVNRRSNTSPVSPSNPHPTTERAAHLIRRSYADTSLGLPHLVALPARTTLVGNPRLHVSGAQLPISFSPVPRP